MLSLGVRYNLSLRSLKQVLHYRWLQQMYAQDVSGISECATLT